MTNGAIPPSARICGPSAGMALDEVVDHLADALAARLDLACPADLVPQRGRDPDGDHVACTAGAEQNST